MILPDHRVDFEITQPFPPVDDFRPLAYIHPIPNDAPAVLGVPPLSVPTPLTPEVGVQVAALLLVPPYVLVNALHADALPAIQLGPALDLLGAEIFLQAPIHILPYLEGEAGMLPLVLLPFLILALGQLRAIPPAAPIAITP